MGEEFRGGDGKEGGNIGEIAGGGYSNRKVNKCGWLKFVIYCKNILNMGLEHHSDYLGLMMMEI